MVVIIILIASILFCTATGVLCYLYARNIYNSVDDVLDRILTRDERLRTENTREDRASKLIHKANRIMDMYISEASQSVEEKEIIQGFISDMSHQMKTPLAGISMYADLLMEGGANAEEQHEFLARIKNGTDSLQWLMDSLIKMSRLEAGAVQLAPVCLNIKQTISDSIENVLAAAAKKNIEISAGNFIDMPLLHDKRWTQEAITNVLENAVKYSDEGGKIEIAVEPLPLHTKVIITDYGTGIDKSEWHKIFKRFYRGKNAKTTGGAGLGLYLAALIMEKQGGYIMVDSAPNSYTAFSLFFRNCDVLRTNLTKLLEVFYML